jgi:hypothetical protein
MILAENVLFGENVRNEVFRVIGLPDAPIAVAVTV